MSVPALGDRILTDVCGRTQMCKFFERGRCALGERCTYAHSADQLREKPNLQYTRLCRKWLRSGHCIAGNACGFAHGHDQLRARPPRRREDGATSSPAAIQPSPVQPLAFESAAALFDAAYIPLSLSTQLSFDSHTTDVTRDSAGVSLMTASNFFPPRGYGRGGSFLPEETRKSVSDGYFDSVLDASSDATTVERTTVEELYFSSSWAQGQDFQEKPGEDDGTFWDFAPSTHSQRLGDRTMGRTTGIMGYKLNDGLILSPAAWLDCQERREPHAGLVAEPVSSITRCPYSSEDTDGVVAPIRWRF
eukprot:TRINITY_DN25061_c0_g1_i1.p1 TRINITY_DN25061_c0_g1~~TRINITY_DN25061_c0_g1_i1.p1  ORF type:complete len:305 (-),score=41.33 TRINITY_DN25061_c0_g1_i1:315-1229(-)